MVVLGMEVKMVVMVAVLMMMMMTLLAGKSDRALQNN
jgi:hypothetical protein